MAQESHKPTRAEAAQVLKLYQKRLKALQSAAVQVSSPVLTGVFCNGDAGPEYKDDVQGWPIPDAYKDTHVFSTDPAHWEIERFESGWTNCEYSGLSSNQKIFYVRHSCKAFGPGHESHAKWRIHATLLPQVPPRVQRRILQECRDAVLGEQDAALQRRKRRKPKKI